ncbi:unnamed protein product [Allacma fusca]|uniref:G-protein coupled receptors family 1 profile domain-containing protein n=1 Tax=Allacma fusca TaxID=39272 RepID=A0A8J2NW73_9HEXA|nr:unnamed protein product [Allacma fusca]
MEMTCEYNENTGYVVYSALGSFFLPLLVMLYVYARIACVISQRHKTIEKLHQNAQKIRATHPKIFIEKCCEDHEGGREETATRVLDSLDEHKIERSSSSSASHTIGTPNSPAERDISLWSRLHCTSSKGTGDSTKSERGCKQKHSEKRKGMVRSNTVVREHCRHEGGRIRTGSRLCHHSISTLSPQRSIHRAKSTTSTAVISFSDGDLSVGTNMRNESSRVWTIEGAEHPSVQSHKLNGRVRGCSGEASSCDNGRIIESSMTEIHSRIYPTQTHHASTLQPHYIHQSGHYSGSSGGNSLQIHSIPVQRRSMKSNVSLHVSTGSSDQNQNSAAVVTSREFTSGRMASFKRETKTAQTLAAVVGGFIICWLPFFVAYVIGPFVPEEDKIPVPLMDALIWLGWGNSAINPFIYAFYSPDFRSAFWRLTFHKFEGLLRARHDGDRNSPRRYDDTITGVRTSN